tara:strand:+ start:165 stop:473 length:309 start_codon:yes stop_codon:yes gene_type:complete
MNGCFKTRLSSYFFEFISACPCGYLKESPFHDSVALIRVSTTTGSRDVCFLGLQATSGIEIPAVSARSKKRRIKLNKYQLFIADLAQSDIILNKTDLISPRD